nr:TorF family putative porin [Sphingomonas sp. CDS-1]
MRSPRCKAGPQGATAPARWPWHRRAATRGCALLLTAHLFATPAAAQLGGSLTLSSQTRLRGQPISDHRPVAELEMVHDGDEGFYLGAAAALVATRDEGLKPLSFRPYAGFAKRLSDAATIDVGIVHNRYSSYSAINGGGSYTEAYVGIAGRHVSGRLYLSPAYFRRDAPTLYMELNGHLGLARNWTLVGHAGRLTFLKDRPDSYAGDATDWRLGLRRRLGRVDLDVAWTGQDGQHGAEGALVIALAFTL